jgi:hypothetical protein
MLTGTGAKLLDFGIAKSQVPAVARQLGPTQVNFVQGWLEELTRKVPAR